MARVARKTGTELVWHIAGLAWAHPSCARLRGGLVAALGVALAVAFATYNAGDPSLNAATGVAPTNALGGPGAVLADLGVQSMGLAAGVAALIMVVLGLSRAAAAQPEAGRTHLRIRAAAGLGGVVALAAVLSAPRPPAAWPLARGLGGFWGDALLGGLSHVFAFAHLPFASGLAALFLTPFAVLGVGYALGLSRAELRALLD